MKKLLVCLAGLCLLWAASDKALAQTADSADVQALIKKVDELVKANEDLKARVEDLEQRLVDAETAPAAPAPAAPCAAAASPQAPCPESAAKAASTEVPVRVSWREGLRLETENGNFKLRIGGRVMFDLASFSEPKYWRLGGPSIEEEDQAEIRALRLKLQGDIYQHYDYQLEVDFADSDVTIKDAYVGLNELPYVGTLRLGHFSEPFGLEQQTTTNYITFMERSMVVEAFAPGRSIGVMLQNSFLDDRMTWAIGAFNDEIDDNSFWNYSARLTGLPFYRRDGARLLHLGAAFTHQDPNGYVSISTYPEAHLGNEHLNTGSFPADTIDRWAFEAALVWGPFSVQSEYMAAQADMLAPHRTLTILDVDDWFENSRRFDGHYVQASYFLTGEHRNYVTSGGYFDRVIPLKDFTVDGQGWGAWELALRYSTIDLNDEDVRSGVFGGSGESITAGMNWYMTPNTRMMLNYIRAEIDQKMYDGDIDIVQGRFQVDF